MEAVAGVLDVLVGENGGRVRCVVVDLDAAEIEGSLALFAKVLAGVVGKRCLVGVRVGQAGLKESSGRGDGVGAKLFRGMGR